MDLEVSSEFLVLAATLLQIKSRMLLPKEDDEDEEKLDPREELVRRLIEYSKIKGAVEFLEPRQNIGASMYFRAPENIERPPAELDYSSLTTENLWYAYKRAYQRLERKQPPPKHSFAGIVGHEKLSVRKRVSGIWNRLMEKSKVMFKELFRGVKSKPEAVASFLALLELVRLKKVRVEYGDDADISNPHIYRDDDSLNLGDIED